MPKANTISPTAIAEAFIPYGDTGTHILKKIARHHRYSHVCPTTLFAYDVAMMKREIRSRSISMVEQRAKKLYLEHLRNIEHHLLHTSSGIDDLEVYVTEGMVDKAGLTEWQFLNYCHTVQPGVSITHIAPTSRPAPPKDAVFRTIMERTGTDSVLSND